MACGGVVSQTDDLESRQFTVEELQAAVYEANMADKYAFAHCHTSLSMANALAAGVRSIEHGSILDEATARRLLEQGTFLVPTLLIVEQLARAAETGGISQHSQMKLKQVRTGMPQSVVLAAEVGVLVGSGSDMLGARQTGRGEELVLKAKLIGPMQAIVSATRTNALLFRLEDRTGCLQEGMEADLIAVAGDPLSDVGLLADAANVRLVVKGGLVYKETL
jgi:imidazolonepropionase-like amidohydrolase